MVLHPHLAAIDGEVFTVLIFLLLSLFSWLKTKFFPPEKEKKKKSDEADPLREIIWRRQMGEESVRMPWQSQAREAPPEPPRRQTQRPSPPPVPPPFASPPRRHQALNPIINREPTYPTPPPVPPPSAIQVALETERPEISAEEAELARLFEGVSKSQHRGKRRHLRGLTAMLRQPASTRNAILLSEILSPPVALRNEHCLHP